MGEGGRGRGIFYFSVLKPLRYIYCERGATAGGGGLVCDPDDGGVYDCRRW